MTQSRDIISREFRENVASVHRRNPRSAATVQVPSLRSMKMSFLNRLLVCEESTSASNSSSDATIEWNDVRCVDLLSDGTNSCPICLGDFVLPQMLECGHVFCLVCALLHFSTACNCCVCNQYSTSKDLRSVRLQFVSPVLSGTIRTFQLVKTLRGITLPICQEFSRVPSQNNVGWWFSRVVAISEKEVSAYHVSEKRALAEMSSPQIAGSIYSIGRALAEDFLNSRIGSITSPSSLNVTLDLDSLYHNISAIVIDKGANIAYQSVDGQQVYLESVWMRALLLHFCKNADEWSTPELLPRSLALPIVFTTAFVLDVHSRKRYRQLNHLSLGTNIVLVDVELRGIVDAQVLEQLSDAITRRLQAIKRIKDKRRNDKREVRREQMVPLSIEWEKSEGISFTRQSVPTAEDFSHSLTQQQVSEPSPWSFSSYAQALGSAPGFADSQLRPADAAALIGKKKPKFRLV